jgi:transposase-like protein
MMENGKPRKRRQLTPEEKWEIFLEVTSQEISQADAARKDCPSHCTSWG